jgi:hypothetical protein
MRILVFGLLAIGAVGFIVVQLLSFGKFMRYRSRDTENDEQDLNEILVDLRKTLVPFTEAELETLSLRQGLRQTVAGREDTTLGIYESIYHEPLVAFAYRDYDLGSNALLVAQTASLTWVYKIANKYTTVSINGRPVGKINHDGTLVSSESNRKLAEIDLMGRENYPVAVGERPVGHIVHQHAASSVNPRAVQLYHALEQDEHELFLALAFLSLVQGELS